MNTVPNANNVDTYAGIVRDYAAARRVQLAAANFLTQVEQTKIGVRECVDVFAAEIMRLADTTGGAANEQTAKDAVLKFQETFVRRMEKPGLSGLATGIKKLDAATTGLCPGDLLILAARPSMGKTALALNIAGNTSRAGFRSLFVSLEMSTQQVISRMVSTEARVPLSGLRSGNISGPWFHAANDAVLEISKWPISFVDCGCSEVDIIRKARKIRPAIVIVDYLQLVRPVNVSGNANYDLGRVGKSLKKLAMDHQIPMILLSQLNRSVAKEKRPPRLDDLRDTGELEQDADMVLFIHSDDHTTNQRTIS